LQSPGGRCVVPPAPPTFFNSSSRNSPPRPPPPPNPTPVPTRKLKYEEHLSSIGCRFILCQYCLELVRNTHILEQHYKNMQDIEFTVQEGRLFMLQTRTGKRTGAAAVKIAVDFVSRGLHSSTFRL